jgi:hypothetical protein
MGDPARTVAQFERANIKRVIKSQKVKDIEVK